MPISLLVLFAQQQLAQAILWPWPQPKETGETVEATAAAISRHASQIHKPFIAHVGTAWNGTSSSAQHRRAPVASSDMDKAKRTWGKYYEAQRVHQQQTFLGARFGQNPLDAHVIQEILSDVKPDLIIETGTNSGGSALFYAFLMMAINPACRIVTIDIMDITHWATKFKVQVRDPRSFSFWKERVTAIVEPREKGGSTSPSVVAQVRSMARGKARVLVILDSCHDYACVKAEIEAFSPLVTFDSYLIVEDTDKFGNGAGKAIREFVAAHPKKWKVDKTREYQFLTEHTDGYVQRAS